VGVQLAAPDVEEWTQPGGKAGAVTASKPSHKILTKNGVGVGVEVGTVAVGVAEGVPVGVGVAEGVVVGEGVGIAVGLGVGVGGGVGVGVAPVQVSGEGPWIPTVIGVPVLKKPTVAFTAAGGRLESNRKLYMVP
jgi:hypothetical protein